VRPLLAGLPRLRSLRAKPAQGLDGVAWWHDFAQGLPLCPQLTELNLHSRALTDELLAAVVAAVPRLQSLQVEEARLATLRCFSETPHLSHSLQQLYLSLASDSLAPAELLHLRPLRALRRLWVGGLSGWVTAELRAQLPLGDGQNIELIHFGSFRVGH